MKNIMKNFGILLLSVFLISIVCVCSLNVSALTVSPTATPTPTTTPTFASFFTCIFGVHIFPGADPMGTYVVNTPVTGSVSGNYTVLYLQGSFHGITVYLSTTHNLQLYGEHGILGTPEVINMPINSHIATTDDNGYYMINNVPLGHYYVYITKSPFSAVEGSGMYIQSVDLTATAPNAIVDIHPVVD